MRSIYSELLKLNERSNVPLESEEFARILDEKDELRAFSEEFDYPKMKDLPYTDLELVDPEADCVYLCGNSLGLQPKGVRACINRELDKWSKFGVYGHTLGEMPWAECDEVIQGNMAILVGAKEPEVTLMNGLTVTQHLLLLSFYQPSGKRNKILLESKAFPSDHYCIESQIRLRNLDPKECMLFVSPREGESYVRPEDITATLRSHGDEIAVVMLSGVQYYTGQLFDMEAIAREAHQHGCIVGFDLAHTVGNVELRLHDWDVDFACWCSYKYLNASAGGIAGAFIHEKHVDAKPVLTGWWGHEAPTRFKMDNELRLAPGGAGFRISNPPPLLCATLEASLKVFLDARMSRVRAKSKLLTGYLEALLIRSRCSDKLKILTPNDPEQRGAQLSLFILGDAEKVINDLQRRGAVCDLRRPNVLRIAPMPLYNSFHDVFRFVTLLDESLSTVLSQ